MNKVIKCGIYARVSTDKQEDSIENQIGQATEFISRLGDEYVVDEECIFIDTAVSGYYTSVFEREAMKKAIEYAKQKRYQVLVFKEISRVGRDKQENPAIVGMFEQYGIRVIAINDNYDSLNKDNITFDILSVLSEQESIKTSSRVSSARRQKALRGEWGGEAPIGYKVDRQTKKLIIDEEKKHIPKLIFDLYVNHGYGTFKIAEYLNQKGMLTKNNREWSRGTVAGVLKNQAYIGNVVHGMRKNVLKRTYDETGRMRKKKMQVKTDPSEWTIVENAHEPIIDKETFYEAQRILKSRTHSREPRHAYHPLTGILICGKCNAGMICQKRTHENKEYRYYICKTYHKYGRSKCKQANVNADKLEKTIVEIVKNRLNNLVTSNINVFADRSKDILRLEKEKDRLIKAKEKAEKDQIDIFSQRDLFSEEVYKEQMMKLKNQILSLEEEISIIENKIEAINIQASKEADLNNIIEEFLKIDMEDTANLRKLLHELIDKIYLNDNHLDIEYNYDLF